MLHLLKSLMGLKIDGAARTITLSAPYLPERVGEVTVRNIRAGAGSAGFTLRRKNGGVSIDVTDCSDGAKVVLA